VLPAIRGTPRRLEQNSQEGGRSCTRTRGAINQKKHEKKEKDDGREKKRGPMGLGIRTETLERQTSCPVKKSMGEKNKRMTGEPGGISRHR